MFKNKIANVVLIILICVTLLVGAAIVVWMFIFNQDNQTDVAGQAANLAAKTEVRPLSADEIVALTVTLDSVTTNLADQQHIINIGLAFQMENKKTYDEFEKLKAIQIQPIVLKLLHQTNPDELFAENGFDNFTTSLMNAINPILSSGKIIQINITSFVVDRL